MVDIRLADSDDAALLADFAARTFRDTFGADNTPEDLALFVAAAYGVAQQRAEIDDANQVVLLAEVDGHLAAYSQLRIGPPPACVSEASTIELCRFYVDRTWHGRGIAHQLMQATERHALARGARAIWLSVWERNPRAQAFYLKSGFRQAGTKPFVVGTDVQTDWVMVRSLT